MTHNPYLPAPYQLPPAYLPAGTGQNTSHTSGEAWDVKSDVAVHGGSVHGSYRDHDAVSVPYAEPRHHVAGIRNAEGLEHHPRFPQIDDLDEHRERATKHYVKDHRRTHKSRENYAQDPKREGRRHKKKMKKVINDAQGLIDTQTQQQAYGTQQHDTHQYATQQYAPEQLSQQNPQQHPSFPEAWWPSAERR